PSPRDPFVLPCPPSGCEEAQLLTLDAAHLPLPEQARTERLVEAPRALVPVENRPLEAMAAACDGQAGDLAHQGRPHAVPPHPRVNEEVLEPEARGRTERRVGLEEKRIRADLPRDLGDQHAEAGSRPECIADQASRCLVVRRRETL